MLQRFLAPRAVRNKCLFFYKWPNPRYFLIAAWTKTININQSLYFTHTFIDFTECPLCSRINPGNITVSCHAFLGSPLDVTVSVISFMMTLMASRSTNQVFCGMLLSELSVFLIIRQGSGVFRRKTARSKVPFSLPHCILSTCFITVAVDFGWHCAFQITYYKVILPHLSCCIFWN